MADEAFALSPISARAAQPSAEDYEAISQAFMETSRGRWFLGEYAKRNRNADTRMVLDAVARIEETIAAQRQPAPESELAAALTAIGSAVDEARAAAAAALDSLALEEHLAPVRKGARVIREIAWRLREIGADGRICDLIDSQVDAIEAGCGKISSTDSQTALSAAFDLLKERIGEFGDSDIAPLQDAEEPVGPSLQTTEEAIQAPAPAASNETPAVVAAENVRTAIASNNAEAAISTPAENVVEVAEAIGGTEAVSATPCATDTTAEAAELPVELADVTAEAAEIPAESLHVTSEAADKSPDAVEAYDEALLDLVALEMAAPDPSGADDAYGMDANEVQVAELASADPILVAEKPEPLAARMQPTALQASIQASIQPSIQPSLGSTLLASGIVRKPTTPESDPLAPIRRMSQAEKIAFFS